MKALPWTLEQTEDLLNGLAILSQVFWGPNPEICREMRGNSYRQALLRLSSFAGEDHIRELIDFIDGFSDDESLHAGLDASYVRLFVSHKGGVTAHLYHSCYDDGQGLLMGRPVEMMKKRLEEAGLALEALGNEPPDHLSVETEYLLLLLEAAHKENKLDLWREVNTFAGQEMRPWLTLFANDLSGEQDCPFYCSATRVLLSLITCISNVDMDT